MRTLTMQILLMMSYASLQAQNDLASLNDEFNDAATLAEWQTHHQSENWPSFVERCEVIENENVLQIEPQSSGWYGEFHRGPFLFKEVGGNFTVTTKILVTGKKTQSPESSYSLAGLMVRNSRPEQAEKNEKGFENWMFLSCGSATKKGKPQLESKNTTNGKSKLKVFPSRHGWVHIAISRIGNTFYQTYRYEDEHAWTLLRVINRRDFPKVVQVGMLAYSDFWRVAFKTRLNRKKFNTKTIKGKPDLIARFDYVRFFRIEKETSNLGYETGFHASKISEREAKALSLE